MMKMKQNNNAAEKNSITEKSKKKAGLGKEAEEKCNTTEQDDATGKNNTAEKKGIIEESSYLLHNEKANRIMQKLQLARMKIVKRLINGKKGRVLDIGCRYGSLEHILGKGFDYYGLDVIKYSPHPKHLQLVDLNKCCKLKYPNKFFDVIVATEILEHLFFIDEIADEMSRILKDNGIIIVSLPNDYQIDARIRFALGRSANTASPSNKFGHHWSFDIRSSKDFLQKKFRILESVNVYASKGARITPKIIKSVLMNMFPSLFITTTLYKVEKH